MTDAHDTTKSLQRIAESSLELLIKNEFPESEAPRLSRIFMGVGEMIARLNDSGNYLEK
jgi:hypothetical protein